MKSQHGTHTVWCDSGVIECGPQDNLSGHKPSTSTTDTNCNLWRVAFPVYVSLEEME